MGKQNKTSTALRLAHKNEYITWKGMNQRCFCPSNNIYQYYGGRGIKVCERWKNSFEAFLSDVGPRPTLKHTLDRIDNNRDYEPGNCRWATRMEQANNRSTNRRFLHNGQNLTVAEWARRTGLREALIRYRLNKAMPLEKVIAPADPKKQASANKYYGNHV